MEISVVLSSMGPGGAQRVVSHLTDGWCRRGHAVTVVTLAEGEDFFHLPDDVSRVRLGLTGESAGAIDGIRANLRRIRRLRAALRDLAPDVVASFIHRTNVLTLLACRRLDLPVIVSERNHPAHYALPRPWRLLQRWTYPRADALVVQTRGIAEWFTDRIPGTDPVVLPNPVVPPAGCDPTLQAGHGVGPGGPRRVLGVGRLVPQKGFDRLIEAFARLAADRPGWHLSIHGDGPERNALTEHIHEAGLGDRVDLPGWTEDVGAELAAADMFCLSSRYEGFPNALLEAMACGVASISFDCPTGPAEIIDHGRNGLLVADGDVPALADAMASLMDDAKERERLGRNALSVRDRYAPDRVLAMWEECLARVAGGPAPRDSTEATD